MLMGLWIVVYGLSSGAATDSILRNPSSTFRLEIGSGAVVCLGPIPRSNLQLSRVAAETRIVHLRSAGQRPA